VEDDDVVREQMSGALEDEGYVVVGASTGEDGIDRVAGVSPDLVITDLRLPGKSGLDVIAAAHAWRAECPVLVVTAHASIDTAVEAMRLGAFHYLQKPLSIDAVLVEVERALEHGSVMRERNRLRTTLSSKQGLGRILGSSVAIENVRSTIRNVAGTDSTVLVTGDTGTGKELVANALHYESARCGGPLVKVNCAALSETLLESELFGHEKGAFTGADRRRIGRFERADGGTLFLDEISEMGANLQAKLLRVLQGEPFERVGGDESIKPDVRLVAATNREPLAAVDEGKLRKDLYYRLNIVRVDVPSLKDRIDDIPVIAEHYLELYATTYSRRAHRFTDEALAALSGHDWPGNVRELENCVERAVVMSANDVIELADLPPPLSASTPAPAATDGQSLNLQDVERRTILSALDATDWNKARASDLLGIFPSSLYKKMKRLGIPQQRQDS
jgi:two-component system response regulator HydG